ncbi:MAG: hypothetical protein NT129_03665, partial [Candidatus Aenigmarchaeota archaeon]|nr:hypothetical protein [Candidatus Aenigmarchaeota archaeon]
MITTHAGPLEIEVLKCGIKGPTPEESYKILIDIMRIVNISEAELIVYGGKYIAVKGSGKDSEIVGLDEDPY